MYDTTACIAPIVAGAVVSPLHTQWLISVKRIQSLLVADSGGRQALGLLPA